MPLRQDVHDAFAALGLTSDVPVAEATKAYKLLALQHHPDRNHNDPGATRRFQQIGHAWEICQKFYENPAWAEGLHYSDDDDIIDLAGEDLFDFYMFMFAETLCDRYNRAKGQRYRHERFGYRAGPVLFSFSSVFSDDSQERQDKNSARQKREKQEYEIRKHELELEMEHEERRAKDQAKKRKADVDRVVGAREHAFQAAHSGKFDEVRRLVEAFALDVNTPRNLKTAKTPRKQDENLQYDSLLHAAACQCDESLFTFLLDKGANPNVLNKQQLLPFHVAIKSGNSKLVYFILEKKRGKSFPEYHPSKATPSGRTPLQLAIESNDNATIELLVKHATTHDVERCWKTVGLSDEVKDILRTKKGFVPQGEGLHHEQMRGISKKAQRQQELTQQKEARIAEDTRRAEVNRQKKDERTARRAIIEREKAAKEDEKRRRKASGEAEEGRRKKVEEDAASRLIEKLCREEEEDAARSTAEAGLKATRKVEREAEHRTGHEAKEQAHRETRDRAEREEARGKAEREAKDAAEGEAKDKAEQEEQQAELERPERLLRERREREVKARIELEIRERSGRETKKRPSDEDRMKVQRQRLEGQRLQMEREKERQRILPEKEEEREFSRNMNPEKWKAQTGNQNKAPVVQSSQVVDIAEGSTVETSQKPGRPVVSDGQRREPSEKLREKKKARATELREKRQPEAIATSSAVPQALLSEPVARKKSKPSVGLEQMTDLQQAKIMRRRTEQSARDKERHRRMMEERRKVQVESQTQSEQSEYVPLTPVSTDAGRHDGPDRHSGPVVLEPTLIMSSNAPSYVEDIQTCVVPDDLFQPDPVYVVSKACDRQPEPTISDSSRKPKYFAHPRR